jgi:hypothetical protein
VVRLRKAYARVQIRIDEGTVRKAYHVDIDQEYDKARRLHELSNPERYAFGKPTALLLEESSIEFELVRPSMTLYRMIDSVASGDIDIGRLLAVVGLCGEALGARQRALPQLLSATDVADPEMTLIGHCMRSGTATSAFRTY